MDSHLCEDCCHSHSLHLISMMGIQTAYQFLNMLRSIMDQHPVPGVLRKTCTNICKNIQCLNFWKEKYYICSHLNSICTLTVSHTLNFSMTLYNIIQRWKWMLSSNGSDITREVRLLLLEMQDEDVPILPISKRWETQVIVHLSQS